MALPVRTQVENAVIALLKDLETSRKVRTVRPYNGELAAPKSEDILRALNGQLPGILVATENGEYHGVQVQRRCYRREIEIALYLVSGSQNAREERTRGANQIYAMEDAAFARLAGVKPVLDEAVAVGHLVPVSEQVIGHDPVVCAWKQTWRLMVEVERLEPAAPAVTEAVGELVVPAEAEEPTQVAVRVSNFFG